MIKWWLLLVGACVAHQLQDTGHTVKPDAPENPGAPAAPPAPAEAAPVTVTPAGTIRGSWMQSRRGRRFQAYRGIHYAQPPVGDLRFQPPVDIEQYPAEVDAREEGPACPLPTRSARYAVDEDCLRLNVYTPDNNSSRLLPVILFLHPGGFYSMSGRSDRFGPHYLLDQDLVLVTINYRLASLGFLSTGDAVAPGNNGFKDQVSALRWVRRNAAAFGGDPGQVTIAGCSAGGRSVLLHMVSPMSKGLFHRGIEMSGAPIGKEPLPPHQLELAQKQASILNCPTNSSRAIVDCLKTKTWQELGNSLSGFWDRFSSDPVGFWQPVIEPDLGQPRFLAEQPAAAVRAGNMHSVPLLISRTEGEFYWKAFTVTRNKTLRDIVNAEWESAAPLLFNLPAAGAAAASRRLKEAYLGGKDVDETPESEQGLGRLYGDSWIGFNTHRTANLMCRHSAHPVWYVQRVQLRRQQQLLPGPENRETRWRGSSRRPDLPVLDDLLPAAHRRALAAAARAAGRRHGGPYDRHLVQFRQEWRPEPPRARAPAPRRALARHAARGQEVPADGPGVRSAGETARGADAGLGGTVPPGVLNYSGPGRWAYSQYSIYLRVPDTAAIFTLA